MLTRDDRFDYYGGLQGGGPPSLSFIFTTILVVGGSSLLIWGLIILGERLQERNRKR